MAIKRLTPTVRDLGFLRLWRDDIAEIAGFAGQIHDVKLNMEADDNELDDVQADLPKVGKRLRYFTLTATRLSGQVLKVRLTSHGCQVEATNPDLETRGIISDIEAVADRCRRVPRWLCPLSPAGGSNAAAAAVLIAVFGGIYSVVAGVSAYDHFALSGNHGVSWPASIISCILSTIITLSIVSMQFRARTLLFTGTNADAPTWWQEYRGHLGIAIISGAIFFVLGLLVHV